MTDREVLQMHSEQIARLEAKLDALDRQIDSEWRELIKINQQMSTEIHTLRMEMQQMMKLQKEHESAIGAMNTLVNGSVVLKWIITAVVFTFSAVGVITTGLDAMKGLAK